MTKMNFDFCAKRKLFFSIAIVLVAIAVIGSFVLGLKLDIQFKGGALITYAYEGNIDKKDFVSSIEEVLGNKVNIQESSDVSTGQKSFVISSPSSKGFNAEKQNTLAQTLAEKYKDNKLETRSINVVNPTIGSEFLSKSMLSLFFAAVLMVIYISIRFKKISGWSAGITAVVALVEDLFAVFAAFVIFGFSIDSNFIAVCLTILGYSLNDTIVIYDRIRENKRIYGTSKSLEELVNLSLNQSFKRSMMTTITTVSAMIVVSVVAYIYNVTSIMSFSIPITLGMISGSFSSMCIAPNLWVLWQNKRKAA